MEEEYFFKRKVEILVGGKYRLLKKIGDGSFTEIYEGLPVTFFKVGDNEDLVEKLLNFNKSNLPDGLRDIINITYSYRIVANTIIQTIEKDLKS